LAQKGFNRSEIRSMTEGIMNLARAGGAGQDLGLDIVTSAEAVSGVLRAFQMDASESARIADLLTATVNGSNYTLEELVTSLSYASPAAADFNVSLEDTLSVLGAIRDLNVDASIAGTALRNMMTYASKPDEQEKFNERLKELTGNTLKFVDAGNNLVNIRDMLLSIHKATEKLGTAQRAELYDMLFETRAAVPAKAVGKSITTLARLSASFAASDGLAAKTAQTMEGGLGGTFREFLSQIEAVAIAIGESLTPSLMSLYEIARPIISSFIEWITANRGLVTSVVAGVAAFGALGLGLLLVGQAVLTLMPLLSLVSFITGLIASFGTFVLPWLLIAGAIHLGVKAVLEFMGVAKQADSTVGRAFGSLVDTIGGYFQQLFTYITNTLYGFVANWETAIPAIGNALARGNLAGALAVVTAAMEVTWLKSLDTIQTYTEDVVNDIKQLWREMQMAPARWLLGTLEAYDKFLTYTKGFDQSRKDYLDELRKDIEYNSAPRPEDLEPRMRRAEEIGRAMARQWLAELYSTFGQDEPETPDSKAPDIAPWMKNLEEAAKRGVEAGVAEKTFSYPGKALSGADARLFEAIRQFRENQAAREEKDDTKRAADAAERMDEKLGRILTEGLVGLA
jgi:TP901 family phage tail tape measure protein